VADVGDIDAADEADFAEARGDGDQGAAVVALALAAELIFGDLGRLAAAGTADAEKQVGSKRGTMRLQPQHSIFRQKVTDARETSGGRRGIGCEICNVGGRTR